MLKQFYRLLSHITFGEKRKYFRNLYKKKGGFERKKIFINKGSISQSIKLLNSEIDKLIEKFDQLNNKISSQMEEFRHYPEIISRLNQRNLSTAFNHQKIFSQFENCFREMSVAVVASGPTLSLFDASLLNVDKWVGVNSAFHKQDIVFDFLFTHDFRSSKPYINEMNNYRVGTCKKFYGICADFFEGALVPKSEVVKADAYYYHTDYEEHPYWHEKHVYDISAQPLGCKSSVVFPALQFIFWGNPKNIYLIGCDATGSSHFDNPNQIYDNRVTKHWNEVLYGEWNEIKSLKQKYYPDVEIISINPVGLKGMFHDIYTKSYLKKHPEININDVEILENMGDIQCQ